MSDSIFNLLARLTDADLPIFSTKRRKLPGKGVDLVIAAKIARLGENHQKEGCR